MKGSANVMAPKTDCRPALAFPSDSRLSLAGELNTAQTGTSPEPPISRESGDDNDRARNQRAAQITTRQRVTKTRRPPEWCLTSPLAPKPGDVVVCSQHETGQRLRKSRLARTSPPPVTWIAMANAECGWRRNRRDCAPSSEGKRYSIVKALLSSAPKEAGQSAARAVGRRDRIDAPR